MKNDIVKKVKPLNSIDAIYVRFADSDFQKTVIAFVKAIAHQILLPNKQSHATISKQDIVELFNKHAYSLYCLHQALNFKDDLNCKNYLRIEEKNVFLGMQDFKSFTNWNGDGCLAYINHSGNIEFQPI